MIQYPDGAGGKGYDLVALKEQPLPETIEQQMDFPFVVVSPQLNPKLYDWSNLIDTMKFWLNEIKEQLPLFLNVFI